MEERHIICPQTHTHLQQMGNQKNSVSLNTSRKNKKPCSLPQPLWNFRRHLASFQRHAVERDFRWRSQNRWNKTPTPSITISQETTSQQYYFLTLESTGNFPCLISLLQQSLYCSSRLCLGGWLTPA